MVLLLPSLLGFSLFYVVPFGISFLYSLSSGNSNQVLGSLSRISIRNYTSIFASDAFRTALANTFRFLLLEILLQLTLGYLLACLIRRLAARRKALTSFGLNSLLLPMILPSGACLIFFCILAQKSGAINTVLSGLNLEPRDFYQSGDAFGLLIAISLWKNLGYTTLILLSGRNAVLQETVEAASVDGADVFSLFFHIIGPQMLPFFSIGIIMTVIASFKAYRESYLLFGMYPHRSVYMLQNYLNNQFAFLNYPLLSAATVVFTGMLGALLCGLLHQFMKKREAAAT